MNGYTAGIDTPWVNFTPLHEQTTLRAQNVAFGVAKPFAGAIVGVYGSGKSALAFQIMQEAGKRSVFAVWEEAAALIDRLVPEGASVLPQEFAGRVREWVAGVSEPGPLRMEYVSTLQRRGHGEIAEKMCAQPSSTKRILVLDEVEQAHQLLLKRIATDDGQPLRALIDGCGVDLRLFLAYAPESYHAVGDADRGRLAYLPVPSLDVRSIQETFSLQRHEANFVWWVSRGRARGVIQAVEEIIKPNRAGRFDHDLNALSLALEALPGVFGVPALLQDGLNHGDLRRLMKLEPTVADAARNGVVCDLHDRMVIADRIQGVIGSVVEAVDGLQPLANELVMVLDALASEDNRAYMTFEDVQSALKVAEARAIESGRMREALENPTSLAGALTFQIGSPGRLERQLPTSVEELTDRRFPSPFTDPMLPIRGAHKASEAELDRLIREQNTGTEPLLRSTERDFLVFLDHAAVAHWLEGRSSAANGVRAVVLHEHGRRGALLDLAEEAGRIVVRDIGRFHATFLKCLVVLTRDRAHGNDLDRLVADLRADRQVSRKVQWHLNRIAVQFRDAVARPSARWSAAERAVLDSLLRANIGATKLDTDSPALLAVLLQLREITPTEEAILQRMSRLLAADQPLRLLATEGAGKRMSGAATVVNDLLPTAGARGRMAGRAFQGRDQILALMSQYGRIPALRRRLAEWLSPAHHERLETITRYYNDEIPNLDDERDQIEALRGIDDTLQRARDVRENLSICTGRPPESLTSLRLAVFTDKVCAASSPIQDFRTLSDDVLNLPRGWVRALALWICSVFADHIVTGVEKEQTQTSEWEALSADARTIGQRCSTAEGTLLEIAAKAMSERLKRRRGELASFLNDRISFSQELHRLQQSVAISEQMGAVLRDTRQLFSSQGVDLDRAIARYLPDEEAAGLDRSTLRTIPDVVAQMDGQLPQPGDRSLVEYLSFVTRLARESQSRRLSDRLSDLLDLVLSPELIANGDDVSRIEHAWPLLPESTRDRIRDQIRAVTVRGTDSLARWIDEAGPKLSMFADREPSTCSAIAGIDERVEQWLSSLDVRPEDLNRVLRDRDRSLASLALIWPSLVTDAVIDAVARAVVDDPQRAFSRLASEFEEFAGRLSKLNDELVAVTGQPSPTPVLGGASADEVLRSLTARLSEAKEARDKEVDRARGLGALITRFGQHPASIPASLSLAGASKLVQKEEARLRSFAASAQENFEADVSAVGLPHTLSQVTREPLARWVDELTDARSRLERLTPTIELLVELAPDRADLVVSTWDEADMQLRIALDAAKRQREELASRYDVLHLRARRLGSEAPARDVRDMSLDDAQQAVTHAEGLVRMLRARRLQGASTAAQALYACLTDSGDMSQMPPELQELVAAGLLRTIEEVG